MKAELAFAVGTTLIAMASDSWGAVKPEPRPEPPGRLSECSGFSRIQTLKQIIMLETELYQDKSITKKRRMWLEVETAALRLKLELWDWKCLDQMEVLR